MNNVVEYYLYFISLGSNTHSTLLSERQRSHVVLPLLFQHCLPPQHSGVRVQPQHRLGVGQRVELPGRTDHTLAAKNFEVSTEGKMVRLI